MIDIMPGADQFSNQMGGTGGGGDHHAGASVSGTPTIWASGSCSTNRCEYKQDSHSDPQGNKLTVNNSNIGASQTSWVNVSVEKGPPTNLSQNANTWEEFPTISIVPPNGMTHLSPSMSVGQGPR